MSAKILFISFNLQSLHSSSHSYRSECRNWNATFSQVILYPMPCMRYTLIFRISCAGSSPWYVTRNEFKTVRIFTIWSISFPSLRTKCTKKYTDLGQTAMGAHRIQNSIKKKRIESVAYIMHGRWTHWVYRTQRCSTQYLYDIYVYELRALRLIARKQKNKSILFYSISLDTRDAVRK